MSDLDLARGLRTLLSGGLRELGDESLDELAFCVLKEAANRKGFSPKMGALSGAPSVVVTGKPIELTAGGSFTIKKCGPWTALRFSVCSPTSTEVVYGYPRVPANDGGWRTPTWEGSVVTQEGPDQVPQPAQLAAKVYGRSLARGQHQFLTREDCGCNRPYCWRCEETLAYCKVCRQGEAELEEYCPGAPPGDLPEEAS